MANTTVQDQWIGERTVIGTATEVTTLEDDQINIELPPGESIPNPQPERKIDLTILDKQIAQTLQQRNDRIYKTSIRNLVQSLQTPTMS